MTYLSGDWLYGQGDPVYVGQPVSPTTTQQQSQSAPITLGNYLQLDPNWDPFGSMQRQYIDSVTGQYYAENDPSIQRQLQLQQLNPGIIDLLNNTNMSEGQRLQAIHDFQIPDYMWNSESGMPQGTVGFGMSGINGLREMGLFDSMSQGTRDSLTNLVNQWNQSQGSGGLGGALGGMFGSIGSGLQQLGGQVNEAIGQDIADLGGAQLPSQIIEALPDELEQIDPVNSAGNAAFADQLSQGNVTDPLGVVPAYFNLDAAGNRNAIDHFGLAGVAQYGSDKDLENAQAGGRIAASLGMMSAAGNNPFASEGIASNPNAVQASTDPTSPVWNGNGATFDPGGEGLFQSQPYDPNATLGADVFAPGSNYGNNFGSFDPGADSIYGEMPIDVNASPNLSPDAQFPATAHHNNPLQIEVVSDTPGHAMPSGPDTTVPGIDQSQVLPDLTGQPGTLDGQLPGQPGFQQPPTPTPTPTPSIWDNPLVQGIGTGAGVGAGLGATQGGNENPYPQNSTETPPPTDGTGGGGNNNGGNNNNGTPLVNIPGAPSWLQGILGGLTGLNGNNMLGFTLGMMEHEALRDYRSELMSTMNRAIDRSDPFFGHRGAHAEQFNRMSTDPNWMNNDAVLQGMQNNAMRNVSSQNAARGYLNSGNILHDLTRTGTETAGNYALQRMQMAGQAAGAFGSHNPSQAMGFLGNQAAQAGLQSTGALGGAIGSLFRPQGSSGTTSGGGLNWNMPI